MACTSSLNGQMITGVWSGKISKNIRGTQLELKLIQKGDSIFGTSYYYNSPDNYRRYSVKGAFNKTDNTVVWWDDQLLEQKIPNSLLSNPGAIPYLAEADFNCPGSGKMMLDGKAEKKNRRNDRIDIHLEKNEARPLFHDEWDFVIENCTFGSNDPYVIDSVALIAKAYPAPAPEIREEPVINPPIVSTLPEVNVPIAKTESKRETVIQKPGQRKTTEVKPVAPQPQSIEEKFVKRKKITALEIPISGDSIEIEFYDNAEIDGDSISLFLNDKLIFEHIRLSDQPFKVKIPVADLSGENNELTMVAENLGSIPPNTSYMVAYLGDKKYDAWLESTEGSSAVIKFYHQ